MSYVLEHTTLGFCWWDLPAAIILIVVIVAFAWKHHDMKKQEKEHGRRNLLDPRQREKTAQDP